MNESQTKCARREREQHQQQQQKTDQTKQETTLNAQMVMVSIILFMHLKDCD